MNRNINKTPVIITDPSQFDTLKPWRPYKFICKSCRKEIVIFSFTPKSIDKAKMMMCGSCRSSYIQKNKSSEEKAKIVLGRKSTLKERYGDENYNNRDQASKTCLEKFGSISPLGNKNIYEETQNTRLKLYGSKNYVETKEFKRQKTETQLKLYGDPNYTNREKADKTFRENHDNVSFSEYSKLNEIKKRTSETNIRRYNGSSPMCSNEVKNKSRQTKQEKYGDPTYTNREKVAATKKERYGDENYNNPEKQVQAAKKYGEQYSSVFQVPEIKEKRLNSTFKKYGTFCVLTLHEIQNKSRQTKQEKYGDPNYTNSEKATETKMKCYGITGGFNHKYNYYGMMFDSLPELAVWIYCIDHNIPIIRAPFIYEFVFNNKTKHYIPDFWIKGKLVEIKGDHFLNKSTNKWWCPFDHTQDALFEAKYDCCRANNVIEWYEKDYKFALDYIINEYGPLEIYRIDNIMNPSYSTLYGRLNSLYKPYINVPIVFSYPIFSAKGISPYDINKKEKFHFPNKGVSPFDIGLIK